LPPPVELDRLRVVLVGTRNPLNIGAAARAMSNFGFLRLRVVNPYDVAFREARSAMGAAPLLGSAEVCSSLAEAVADCSLVIGTTSIQHRELLHPIRRLDEGAALIRQQLTTAPVALLFGSEKFGLSNEELSHCHWLINIPTRDEHVSMNLGQAVAVALYELVRENKTIDAPELPELATAGDVERVTVSLLEALNISGYSTPATMAATEEKIRRLVHRMNLTTRDAELWLGILRQILWKLRSRQNESGRDARTD
jgi:TrmH family RNA methyltransferase